MKNKKSAIIELFLLNGFHIEAASPAAVRVISNFHYIDIIQPLIENDVNNHMTKEDLILRYDITERQARYYFNKYFDVRRLEKMHK